MKRTLLLFLSFWLFSFAGNAQVIINEILPGGTVELKNIGNAEANVSSYWLCDFPSYQQIQNSNIICGDMMLGAGEILTVNNFNTIAADDGEMGLYATNSFGNASAILDYVEWGSTGHQRSSVAVEAGIWSEGDFAPAFSMDQTLAYDGDGNSSSDWSAGNSTICQENVNGCNVDGGTLEGGPFEFTVGDGQADMIPAGSITVANSQGANFQWIVTDDAGNILGLPPMPSVVNFDGAGAGTCQIWYLRFDGEIAGLGAGLNISNLEGCFDLSNNSVQIIRTNEGDCQANGGELFGGPFEFTVGDGQADMIPAGSITVANSQGANFQWIVTDDAGNILGLPPMPGVVNFDGAGAGTCQIWYLRFDGEIAGLGAGLNINNLDGCFDLSNNSVQIIRTNEGDCQANGGELFGGPFEFTVGDGQADMIPAGSITVANSQGANFQWIVTDDAGNILGLPPMPSVVNFDGAGAGTCQIWYLRFDGEIAGLGAGLNINNLEGCFDLSNNSVQIIRTNEGDCQANGGELFGGPFEFTVGDGQADMIPAGSITVANSQGANFQWIVTDDAGNILGLPPMPSVVNFDGAGAGTCQIWYLRFDGEIAGLGAGLNISNLEGCFDLSNNSVQIIRTNEGDCQANGGELFGGPFEFTVGDGQADMIPAGSITVANSQGANFQWIVTDDAGNILGLPPMPSVVNFDGAGAGTCQIWYLRFDGEIAGLGAGLNINNLEGCFDLSNNSVQIIRTNEGDCQANGGELFGGPFEFTVGDGQADMIPAGSITVANSQGANFQWIVTDDAGNILGLPPMPSVVNFDGAGAGTCQIWYLRFDGEISGLEAELNISNLEGCFDLSNNSVQVIRTEGNGCNVDGGTLEGGPFEFCVGDDIADNVAGITLSGNSGSNSQWVVTDEDGTILGLPPSPEVVDFNGAGSGTCLIWHLSFEDGLVGAEMGMNANDLQGCFSLSNPIAVVRNQPEGGTLEGGPFEFCVGDDIADMVAGITLSGNSGSNSQWVVTDEDGNILGLPPSPEAVNFDGAGSGTCLIWHLSFEDGLVGAEMGMNANDLQGCFSLSNPIAVVRNQPEGGTLEGGPFEFCVGDDIADNVAGITLSGNSGSNSQWVVTDEDGNILGLPPSPEAVNFDGAGSGTCLIWHLSFEDGLVGAEMGMNANDLQGCFSLSNPIAVVRNQPEGGTLEGGPFEFCVGDDIADMVAGITLSGNSGSNSQWVVTDEDGTILGLPPSPEAVNFDGAGSGTCLIWHLSFEDGLVGAEMGMNANDLQGCFSLSNPIAVVRNQPEGGTLEGGPFEFCVGDDIADMVAGITLSGNSGSNSQWVVTDEDGTILGLPPSPEVVDFNGAGSGTCLIWHLSFEDGLVGAEMGMNANDLQGCFSLSNPIAVVRNQPEGGTLEGGPFEFCVGDDIADMVAGITLSGNSGSNSQWVVTDEDGTILGLPPSPEVVDFNGAGAGTCLIWHLSFEDGLVGAEMGMNANDLQGCFSLSNPIAVVRNQPEGGTLEGGPFEFCVGDDIADNVAGITLSGNSGSNAQWVVTDEDGTILGLPPSPEAVDFNGAGAGTCLIWHLSFEDGLVGAEMGMNANDLQGCFSLSNPIAVVRNQPEGGTLEGGPFEFCVGDDIADNVAGITLSGNSGSNSQWVVTDEDGNILGLPPSPEAVNFDGAGPGTCLIWHLSFEDGLVGAEMGMNANDLQGCFSLSNPIAVVRNQPDGGDFSLAEGGTEISICAGDEISDAFDVVLTGVEGSNSAWVITDTEGNILGLPSGPPFDLEGAGAGTCLVWHISFEDGLEGAEVGLNANDLQGCYDLSNPITVYRLTGEDCDALDKVDISLSIDVDDTTYEQYENTSYFITATNDGTSTVTNVVIAAGLPEGMVYTSDNPSAGDYNLFFEEWTIDELAAGESATLELELFTLVEDVDITNFVEVVAQDQLDDDSTPDNGNGSTPQEDDEAAITIVPADSNPTGGSNSDLSLSISADASTYDQYENVTYTITLTNDGPDDATGIAVAAGLPEGMVYTDDNVSAGDYSLFFEEWSVDFLASGESATLELVLFTLVEDEIINNFVEVIASDQNDDDSTPDNGNGVTPQEDDEAAISISPIQSFAGDVASNSNESATLSIAKAELYPNPANNELNVNLTLSQSELVDLQVFDLTGRVMKFEQVEMTKGLNNIELHVQDLPDGMYFLNIRYNNSEAINKRFQKVTN